MRRTAIGYPFRPGRLRALPSYRGGATGRRGSVLPVLLALAAGAPPGEGGAEDQAEGDAHADVVQGHPEGHSEGEPDAQPDGAIRLPLHASPRSPRWPHAAAPRCPSVPWTLPGRRGFHRIPARRGRARRPGRNQVRIGLPFPVGAAVAVAAEWWAQALGWSAAGALAA